LKKKLNPIRIFLDLTKAYDILNHKVLLSKLHYYGIRGVANFWFESYLSHRKQCVEINNTDKGIRISTTKEIKHGGPQGSILGPILFSLYINDLSLNITGTKIVLFADDTNILVTDGNINNLRYKLNNVMTDLQTWFTLNNLIVNTEKTLRVSFHTLQNKKYVTPQVTFAGRDIPYNSETKFLGIYLNENMKCNNHIKYLNSELNTSYCMISTLKNITSLHVLRTMYFACFHAHLR